MLLRNINNAIVRRRALPRRRLLSTAKPKAMRAVVQRASSGSVTVEGEEVSRIGPGLVVLVGCYSDETQQDADWMVKKLANLRVFENPESGKKWDKSACDLGLEVLCVSNFTITGQLKGNKMDYAKAMPPSDAREFYANFIDQLRASIGQDKVKGEHSISYIRGAKIFPIEECFSFASLPAIADGIFGARMMVSVENDGMAPLPIPFCKDGWLITPLSVRFSILLFLSASPSLPYSFFFLGKEHCRTLE